MATYNVGAIVSLVQDRLNDTAFPTSSIINFINNINSRITNSHRFNFMEGSQTYTPSAASLGQQGDFNLGSLPGNYQIGINLRITDPDNFSSFLQYVPYETFDKNYPDPDLAAHAAPVYWYIFQGSIFLYPFPDQVYTFQLRYIKKPTQLAQTSDVPDIPQDFQEILVMGAYMQCLERNDAFDQALLANQQYNGLLVSLIDRYAGWKQYGQPIVIPTGRRKLRPI